MTSHIDQIKKAALLVQEKEWIHCNYSYQDLSAYLKSMGYKYRGEVFVTKNRKFVEKVKEKLDAENDQGDLFQIASKIYNITEEIWLLFPSNKSMTNHSEYSSINQFLQNSEDQSVKEPQEKKQPTIDEVWTLIAKSNNQETWALQVGGNVVLRHFSLRNNQTTESMTTVPFSTIEDIKKFQNKLDK